MTRCPFSLSRLVKVSHTGQVVYQAEKQACRAFPDPKGDGTRAGVKRNFQILSPLDFLAEKRYQGQPAGGVLIAVPSSFLANGKLAAIQQSFVDISGWQQLPTESKVDWVLSRSR